MNSPSTGVTDSCEPRRVGAGNRTPSSARAASVVPTEASLPLFSTRPTRHVVREGSRTKGWDRGRGVRTASRLLTARPSILSHAKAEPSGIWRALERREYPWKARGRARCLDHKWSPPVAFSLFKAVGEGRPSAQLQGGQLMNGLRQGTRGRPSPLVEFASGLHFRQAAIFRGLAPWISAG